MGIWRKYVSIVGGAVAVLLVGSLLAGCGGGSSTVTVTETVSSGESEASELQESAEEELAEEEAGSEETASASGDCAEKEIASGAHKEGTCTENGVKSVVVDMHSPLKLETLEASLKGVQERKSISAEGETETANGVYATFEVAITNLGHTPVEFEEDQSIGAVNSFILAHEFGHALIANYELPVLGKEEDAADAISTILLLTIVRSGAWVAGEAPRVSPAGLPSSAARQRRRSARTGFPSRL